MQKLLVIVLFAVAVHAQVPPLIRSGANLAESPAVAPAIPLGAVSMTTYLGPCSSSTNVNACATRAANDAKAAGHALYFPAGTYPLSVWSPPCPLQIIGDGQGTTVFKRPASSAGSVINSTSCGGLRISNLTVDGNKADNLTIGYAVILNGDWNFTLDNVEIENSKGAGSALTVQSTTDDSTNTHSVLSKLYIHDNDGNGVYFQKRAWNWALQDSVIQRNGGVGVTAIDYVFPPVAGQFSNCAIVHNDISYNARSGISLTSGVIGGTPSKPTNGPFNTIQNCKILGNQANHNSSYGIIMSGGYDIEIASNTAMHNGMGQGSAVAGINSSLCEGCDVHDNITQYNDYYGIDAGGAIDTIVHHNVITNNGNSTINNGNGINCGACQGVEISDNLISSNGAAGGGPQIHVTTYDGGSSGFSISAQNITIRRNHLICANGNEVGVLVLSDPPNTTIEDNWTEGCTTLKGYVLHVTNAQVHRNRQDNWSNGVVFTPASGNAVYPDAAENVYLSSLPAGAVGGLSPYFYSTNYQTVYAVVVTGGGSSYSTSPSVDFSGGGCKTEPTGTVFQDNVGHVVGVNLSSYGAGCTYAPTVTFRDGTGSGATATAHVLTALPIDGRTLNVLWPTDRTAARDPNDSKLTAEASIPPPGNSSHRVTFHGRENHWIETTPETIAP